jgi:ABC-type Fe3+ transport system substrate-binding protein
LLALVLAVAGCESATRPPDDARTRSFDEQVRAKWGKGLYELPRVELVGVSPHNENILQEFTWAFILHHALEHGQYVDVVWRDVGGGGSTIEGYVLGSYANADPEDIDVIWGGGDSAFIKLASPYKSEKRSLPDGLLEPLNLNPDVLEQMGSPGSDRPHEFNGLALYDPKLKWVGSAVSGFGFIYNAGMLRKCGIAPPTTWDDIADSRFTDLLTLADPSQSGSVAQAYRLIAQSEPTWAQGWAKLLGVLSNASRISDSAGAAANAPVLGDALVAASIDFYGLMRVAEAPDQLVYVNPQGQTTYGPDPIGVLRNPPHKELAMRFVNFVLSRRAQALWALQVGTPDGPVNRALGRLPIRRDVYTHYAGKFTPGTHNFYDLPQQMNVTGEGRQIHFNVLRQLVAAAAVDNIDDLRRARRKLNELARDPATFDEFRRRKEIFASLPDDVATVDAMKAVGRSFDDPANGAMNLYRATLAWRTFFRDKYRQVAR